MSNDIAAARRARIADLNRNGDRSLKRAVLLAFLMVALRGFDVLPDSVAAVGLTIVFLWLLLTMGRFIWAASLMVASEIDR